MIKCKDMYLYEDVGLQKDEANTYSFTMSTGIEVQVETLIDMYIGIAFQNIHTICFKDLHDTELI